MTSSPHSVTVSTVDFDSASEGSNPSGAAKAWWKSTYRLLRIARRETDKAFIDAMIYGTGCIEISDEGICKHIPIDQVFSHD